MAITIAKASVTNGANSHRYTYSGDTGVTAGASTVFAITTPQAYGKIMEISFESSSTDCDVWLSEVTGEAVTGIKTRIAMEAINLGYAPELSSPVSYVNGDTTPSKTLYVTIAPTTVDTGAWELAITFDR